jgi:polyribonucleotide nucleotidyltransferase
MVKTFKLDNFGYEVELGKVAQQADGAVWFKQGGTVILVTAVSAPTQEFPGFLPLTVDYREYFSAAGKIPGGYFKREGKPSDKEVLTSRLIDRALRPLFPETYFNQLQVLATVYSVDKEHTPNTIALVAASLALTISKIPFMGPIGAIEMARIDGQWVAGPIYTEALRADARVVVAGTEEGISMVEGSAHEMSEAELLEVLFMAHDKIKEQVLWQKSIQKECGVTKEVVMPEGSKSWQGKIRADFWTVWGTRLDAFLTADSVKKCYIADKVQRNSYLEELRNSFIELHKQEIETEAIPGSIIGYLFDARLRDKITDIIFALQRRIDDRSADQIRQIASEIEVLPCAHGSSLFTRGRTQALASVTLGSGDDEQKIDSIMEDTTEAGRFMLHYNFPPFSVGEAKFLRGPGRREVGHGNLAASSLRRLLPAKLVFPYTIRIVVDILECDGSSSMATICSSSMALMQAGVPLENMVGGIAMGLLKSRDGNFMILSDITGFEDAFGLMDFKVAGTDKGITAIQMDIKYKGGLPREVFEKALAQARTGRLHILGEMRKTISEPRAELSLLVPRFVSVKVNSDKIGAIIGTGGKVIREITEKTKTSIDIESDGTVNIFGVPGAEIDRAVRWVKTLAGQIEPGEVFKGTIRKLAEFGLFVEMVPGQDGLVHISNIPREKQRTFMNDYNVGDELYVQVVEHDAVTGKTRLRIIDAPRDQQ